MLGTNHYASCAAVLLLVLLSGCSQEPAADKQPPTEPATATQSQVAVETPDPNSMQGLREAALAREAMPGKQHFEQACAVCHASLDPNQRVHKAPHKDMIGLMTPEAILAAMTQGVMRTEASGLSEQQQIEVAEYLAGTALGTAQADIPQCDADIQFDALSAPAVLNWGLDLTNKRHQSRQEAGIGLHNVTQLQTRWAVSFPGANRVRSQPSFAGGLIFIGAHNGRVYALDPQSGCQVWAFQASAEVRTGIVVAQSAGESPDTGLYFGDVLGNVYSLNARNGDQMWRLRADDHPNATITGTPSFADGKLFVPVSSLEVALAVDPEYPCCTFQGSILAVDALSGERLWQRSTIEAPPTTQAHNEVGTEMIGPSGAVVWNSPAIDLERRQLYFGTGENMSSPATATSDAMFALDMDDGSVNWVFQATANDVWNTACDTQTPQNCPPENGPDFDFGAATLLVESRQGPLVIGGQKSGLVHALDAESGKLVWQTRVGRGGIQGGIHFGMATFGEILLVPISDMQDGRSYPDPARPGLHGLDINSGRILWSTLQEDNCDGRAFCHPGVSQVPTVIGDLVFAGAMDGVMRAYDPNTGEVVWMLDTTASFDTVLGTPTRGGSFGGAAGPVAWQGQLLLSSGYGIYNHMAGNLLLMLAVD
ncbi:MAG: PQQ-binding-like beta-propeller repeat protein [Pseudomonadales bacterium]